jgi:hypothetical protein
MTSIGLPSTLPSKSRRPYALQRRCLGRQNRRTPRTDRRAHQSAPGYPKSERWPPRCRRTPESLKRAQKKGRTGSPLVFGMNSRQGILFIVRRDSQLLGGQNGMGRSLTRSRSLLKLGRNDRYGSFATGSCQQLVRPCPPCTESGSKFRAFVTHRPLG